ncbi:class I glutamine amidotransferase-like protein [Exidia glandulosa HHB12029]|uniref:Class I glutamine amidotransferase-like protein n=1 Tax=Exidia glandulosa HHB12029 TaxID=1314781 RepID=A0A165KWQ5_EXIGL|nr:class I glutamine amidotransferase-like protein [Exidia glandulosa HHB12029]
MATAADITHIACVVYPGYDALDLAGALEPLTMLSSNVPFQFYVVGPSLEPVTTKVNASVVKTVSPSFGQSIAPTHTYDNPPEKIDFLIIPGGMMFLDPIERQQPTIDFVKKTYPKVKYVLSVCTGSVILAQAGILDGKRATSNKACWAWVMENCPNVNWVAKARWVVDGNVWTTSGVAAGMDGMFAWITQIYGEAAATVAANVIEYDRHTDASWDPFSDAWRTTDPDHGKSVQPKFTE